MCIKELEPLEFCHLVRIIDNAFVRWQAIERGAPADRRVGNVNTYVWVGLPMPPLSGALSYCTFTFVLSSLILMAFLFVFQDLPRLLREVGAAVARQSIYNIYFCCYFFRSPAGDFGGVLRDRAAHVRAQRAGQRRSGPRPGAAQS